jgi:hypothetical protein
MALKSCLSWPGSSLRSYQLSLRCSSVMLHLRLSRWAWAPWFSPFGRDFDWYSSTLLGGLPAIWAAAVGYWYVGRAGPRGSGRTTVHRTADEPLPDATRVPKSIWATAWFQMQRHNQDRQWGAQIWGGWISILEARNSFSMAAFQSCCFFIGSCAICGRCGALSSTQRIICTSLTLCIHAHLSFGPSNNAQGSPTFLQFNPFATLLCT